MVSKERDSMAITATPDQPPLVHAYRTSRAQAAQKVVADLRGQLADVEAHIVAASLATEPYARARGRLEMLTLEPERLRLAVEIERAEADLDESIEVGKEELRIAFRARKRAVLAVVVPALRAAQAEMIVLQELEQSEHELLGFVDRRSWSSLGRNDCGESFVDEWIGRLRQDGLFE